AEFPPPKAGLSNPSPRRELMELFRAFNELELDIDRDKFFYSIMRSNEAYARSADLLDHAQCVALMAEFADGNAELVEEFHTGDAALFPEMRPGDPPAIWLPESEEYFAMLVDFVRAVWRFAKDPEQGAKHSMQGEKKKKRREEVGS